MCSIVENADLIIKKEMEHKEITREKEILKILSLGMKESSEKAMEIKIELRLNVDEQEDAKRFKVQSDKDDLDEV